MKHGKNTRLTADSDLGDDQSDNKLEKEYIKKIINYKYSKTKSM